MKEHPILFSGAMVRAILDNKKTQTRRVVKPPPDGFEWAHKKPGDVHWWEDWNSERKQWERHELPIKAHCLCYVGHIERCANPLRDLKSRPVPWESSPFDCPYGTTGDRLWVREMMREDAEGVWRYAADNKAVGCDRVNELAMVAWAHHNERTYCPSIHMPRWASRLTLENKDVRVERLQDISEEDAYAEGISRFLPPYPVPEDWPKNKEGKYTSSYGLTYASDRSGFARSARSAFARLWDEINPKHSWSSNPWIWVVEFKQVAP